MTKGKQKDAFEKKTIGQVTIGTGGATTESGNAVEEGMHSKMDFLNAVALAEKRVTHSKWRLKTWLARIFGFVDRSKHSP